MELCYGNMSSTFSPFVALSNYIIYIYMYLDLENTVPYFIIIFFFQTLLVSSLASPLHKAATSAIAAIAVGENAFIDFIFKPKTMLRNLSHLLVGYLYVLEHP